MDDFNNFFDEQPNREPVRTPIYHTPEPKHKDKNNLSIIICMVIAVIMCVLVIVNVIVLSTLKNTIAAEYASSMEASMREQYYSAISDSLSDTSIVEDVTNVATGKVIDALDTTIGEIAENYATGVARLYMYESAAASSSNPAGLATGFLISDTNENGTSQRYLITNAHCVRYAKKVASSSGNWPFGGGTSYRYEGASYDKILAVFEDDETTYTTEIVAYGAYYDSDHSLRAENEQPDLAVLRITGKQPSNTDHVSLKLAANDYSIKRGTPVALIGNPEGIGDTNSITSGTISKVGIHVSSWGAGTFIMTDAAVKSVN